MMNMNVVRRAGIFYLAGVKKGTGQMPKWLDILAEIYEIGWLV